VTIKEGPPSILREVLFALREKFGIRFPISESLEAFEDVAQEQEHISGENDVESDILKDPGGEEVEY
jgi:hypothetical protein